MSKKIKILTLSDMPLSPSGVGIQTKNMIEALIKLDPSIADSLKKNKETYDLITIEIMERISNLLPDKYKSKRGKILEKDFIYTKTLG